MVTHGPSSSAALPLKVNLGEFSGTPMVRTSDFMAQGLDSVPD